MIKPPAMGVFARDPPTTARGGASPASSTTHLPHPSSDPSSSSSRLLPADEPASDPINPEEEPAQDDDDQGTVDEEAGVIRCICGCDDDDGFTIQCDRCLVWQHCACFGMSQASVPDEYLCEQCDPRPVDVAFAQAHQQKRKNNEARKALMDRNLKRQAQALASNTYTQTYLGQDAVPSPTSSTHPPASATVADHSASTIQQTAHPASTSAAAAAARSRKPSQALDLTNTQFVVPELPASAGTAQRGGGTKQRKGQKGSRRGFDTPSSVSTPVRGVFTPGSSHERADDPFDLADQLEAWHFEFTPITKNMVVEPSIVENLAMAMLDWEDGSPLKAVQGPAGRVIAPTASRLSHSSKLAHSESYPPSSSTSSPSSSSPCALGSPIPEAELVGISAVGQECIPVEMSGPSLTDLACRTYVKHISESASAGVFSNLLYVNNSADEPQRGWCASRAFSRPVMHGLFADGSIPAGAFITELRGELYSADAYRNNPINQYAALGATKPHVHLLPPPLNLAIDARRYGNEARFARFSCHPNAVLRPVLFHPSGQSSARSRTSSRAQSPAATLALSSRHNRHVDTPPVEVHSDEPQLVFGLFALTDIPRTHEITLGWEWDDAHIVHFLPELVQNPFLESRHADVDAHQHTANMVALAEKGEFPYAETEFSAKMSTVAAALLGSVLCACIGSAAPPGGGGGASANNGRKQDCAVAQMLRVGNGMSLLNVNMPGKANRRAKLPDFAPLVGVRRYWRPYSLPPTPETSAKDSASPVDHAALAALAAGDGQLNGMDVDDETGCGSNEKNVSRDKRRKGGRAKQDRMQIEGDPAASDADEGDDTRSIASSLTDPLSGLSDNDTLSEDEDHDLMDALRAANDLPSRRRPGKSGDADAVDTELSGLFLLPPKKRSMRTRIKAILAPSDDDEAMNEDVVEKDEEVQQTKAVKGMMKAKAGAKRKGKADARRAALGFSADEEQDDGGFDSTTTPVKKRRKAGNVVDPSSPLSSVPSPNTDDSNAGPPTPVPRLSKKHRFENERRLSDVELSKKKRAAKRGGDRKGKASEPRPKESASNRRKREEARIHRNAILDLGDTESSQDDLSEESGEEEAEDLTNADSRASTPRAAVKQAKNAGEATGSKKVKNDLLSSSPIVTEDQKLAKEDTPTKTKKVRRIVSDSEASSDEEAAAPASAKEGTGRKEELARREEDVAAPMPQAVDTKPAAAKLKIETETAKLDAAAASQTSAAAPTAAPAPAPVPEVKKEEPRVKLSLAEYKRRLAERRVSGQQVPTSSSGPLTPSLATPTSEVTPSPSPAMERSNPLPSPSVRSSEPPSVTAAGAETVPTPTGVIPPAVSSVPVITEPAKPSAAASATTSAAPRGVLFTSISAPTAIRSVEIPKSPSPEPAAAQVPAGSASSGATAAATAPQEVVPAAPSTEAGAVSSTVGPASSPASNTSTLPSAGAASETPALLMRLETIRGRAASVSQQPGGGDKDAQQQGTAGNVAAADADGFAKPQSHSTAPAATPTTAGWGAASSTPLRSPSHGPTRVQPPHSPSGSATFNPPSGPRAFMSPPSASLPPSSMAPASSNTAGSVSGTAAPASSSAAAPATSPAVTSTPARIGIAGVAAGMANTPSSASSASSTASTRYAPPSLTSPTPATTALPRSAGGYPPRDYAGVPKGPSSMRDADPRADAWAEAREAREARGGDYYGAPPRHHDGAGAGRDMGWGERTREPAAGWGRRDPAYRDAPPAGAGYARDEGAYPYRRPSATEYDDAGGPGYDRPADPYNRGIVVRGRSLIGGGGAAPPAAGTAQPPAREYRDYDDAAPRGGYRGGGWGGRGRPRGGRGRGWMR